jgi:hypothetical protein
VRHLPAVSLALPARTALAALTALATLGPLGLAACGAPAGSGSPSSIGAGGRDAADPGSPADPASSDAPGGSGGGAPGPAAAATSWTGRLRASRTWRTTWSDDFDGPKPGDDPSCFTRAPQCVVHDWLAPKDCPAASAATGVDVRARLAKLDKCTWSVLSFQNFWSGTSDTGQAVNALDPGEVAVEGGDLVLTGRARQGLTARDCGRTVQDPTLGVPSRTKECPIVSGAVWAQPYGNPAAFGSALTEGQMRGKKQAYGRFEFQGRLSHGTETWPAFWLLPHATWDHPFVNGWPADGEIDVMEAWSPVNGYSANFHTAVQKNGRWVHFQNSQDFLAPSSESTTLYSSSHLYAVEWDHEEMRFYLDAIEIGRIHQGDTRDRGHYTDTGELVSGTFSFDMPSLPFFPIVNLSLKGGFPGADANPITGYATQELRVGWVRSLEQCAAGDASCVESTVSPACPRPCGGLGDWDGKGCLVGEAPNNQMDAFADAGTFSYALRDPNRGTTDADCAAGDAYDALHHACVLGTVQGRRAWVENDPGPVTVSGPAWISVLAKPGRFYVDPVCRP